MTKKLDAKAIGAGVLLLLNVVLWFVQTGLSYAIADGGFWGIGGLIQNYTVVLAEPANFLFLLAVLVAAITLLTRKPIAAVIGLLLMAAGLAYVLVPDISPDVTKWIDSGCRVLGIVFVAIAVALADKPGAHKVVCGIAVTLVLAWWLIGIVLNILGDVYTAMPLPVTAVYITRGVLMAAGLILAACALTEKQPKGAHWA